LVKHPVIAGGAHWHTACACAPWIPPLRVEKISLGILVDAEGDYIQSHGIRDLPNALDGRFD
jgi:hypothetical protein